MRYRCQNALDDPSTMWHIDFTLTITFIDMYCNLDFYILEPLIGARQKIYIQGPTFCFTRGSISWYVSVIRRHNTLK